MTVTTKDGAVYSIEYRDLDGAGTRLACRRAGGPDDAPESPRPMIADRWYEVATLDPLPPAIAARLAMVLDPVDGDADPIVRYSTVVMSVVGTL
jgi:hypothetical protein